MLCLLKPLGVWLLQAVEHPEKTTFDFHLSTFAMELQSVLGLYSLRKKTKDLKVVGQRPRSCGTWVSWSLQAATENKQHRPGGSSPAAFISHTVVEAGNLTCSHPQI